MIFIPVIYFIAKEYFLSWVFLLKYHCFVHLATLGRHPQYFCSLKDTLQQIIYTRPLDFVFFLRCFNEFPSGEDYGITSQPASLSDVFFWVNINIYLFFHFSFHMPPYRGCTMCCCCCLCVCGRWGRGIPEYKICWYPKNFINFSWFVFFLWLASKTPVRVHLWSCGLAGGDCDFNAVPRINMLLNIH